MHVYHKCYTTSAGFTSSCHCMGPGSEINDISDHRYNHLITRITYQLLSIAIYFKPFSPSRYTAILLATLKVHYSHNSTFLQHIYNIILRYSIIMRKHLPIIIPYPQHTSILQSRVYCVGLVDYSMTGCSH